MSAERKPEYQLYLPEELPKGWKASHTMLPITDAGLSTKVFNIDISGVGEIIENPAEGISIAPLQSENPQREFSIALDSLLPADLRRRGRFNINISWVEDPTSPSRGSTASMLEDVLSVLDEREKKVIRMRFGLDNGELSTKESVAREINRSRRTVGRIEETALAKLKQAQGIPADQLKELFMDASDIAAYKTNRDDSSVLYMSAETLEEKLGL